MTMRETSADEPEEEGGAPHALERPRGTDQLYQSFPNTPVHSAIDPTDGLPSPVVPHSIESALAPRLTRRTLVCLGDYSSFVVRGEWGDIVARVSPELAHRSEDGRWRAPRRAVMRAAGRWFWWLAWGDVEVDPLIPQCRHYAAQLQDFPQDPDHRLVLRHCTARRVDYGDFLSLNDQAMYACELRSPALGNNMQTVRLFDAKQIAENLALERAQATESEDFDLEAALQAESTDEDDDAGGIFGR